MRQMSLFDHSTCTHLNLLEQKEPDESIHYARSTCADCGKFIKWISKPKPANVSIVRLLLHPDLEEWQEEFLKAIVYRGANKAEAIVVAAIDEQVNKRGYAA